MALLGVGGIGLGADRLGGSGGVSVGVDNGFLLTLFADLVV